VQARQVPPYQTRHTYVRAHSVDCVKKHAATGHLVALYHGNNIKMAITTQP